MSADHIAALEAAPEEDRLRHYTMVRKDDLHAVLSEVKSLRADLAAEQARADMHADLGRRTAEALGIPLEEGRAHMPELAMALKRDAEALRLAVAKEMDVFIRAGRWTEAVRPMGTPVKVPHGLDALGATRIAIKMAAGEESAQAAKERT